MDSLSYYTRLESFFLSETGQADSYLRCTLEFVLVA